MQSYYDLQTDKYLIEVYFNYANVNVDVTTKTL